MHSQPTGGVAHGWSFPRYGFNALVEVISDCRQLMNPFTGDVSAIGAPPLPAAERQGVSNRQMSLLQFRGAFTGWLEIEEAA